MAFRIANCPICYSPPDIGLCSPWMQCAAPQPFYAVCNEHRMGVNGDTRRDAIKAWNMEVRTFQQIRDST